ncbi:MAG: peptidoglycan DD-metalloendopeptidase family protein [Thermoleophilia bacterium]|nr:peptidoglycan DD-metalloendopeptidase family protein [Thermoleophilia bacterium]
MLIAVIAGVVAALALTTSLLAAPGDSERKSELDRELAQSQDELNHVRGKEQVLSTEVAAYTSRIRSVESQLEPLEARLGSLEAEVSRLRSRLESLTSRLLIERQKLVEAEDELAKRRLLLERRLKDIYVRGETDPIVVLLQTRSINDATEAAKLMELAVDQDRDTANAVREYAASVKATRDKIAEVRKDVEASEARAAAAAEEVRRITDELRKEREGLSKLQSGRKKLLSKVTADRAELEAHTSALAAESAALAARINGLQSTAPTSGSSPSASGFIWPVSGPLTSTFGPRWGRMHEGIDISGSTGTGIAAAAGGTVIIAGPQGGYGNLVVVDHGGGVSTAYAHLSSIGVGVGQAVAQGSVVGGLGNTGNSTGPHLHFEVRVNGAAQNPLGYL